MSRFRPTIERLFTDLIKAAWDHDPIVSPAIRLKTGEVFSNPENPHLNHYGVARKMVDEAGVPEATVEHTLVHQPNGAGFVTRSGKYLNRTRALIHAIKHGQHQTVKTTQEFREDRKIQPQMKKENPTLYYWRSGAFDGWLDSDDVHYDPKDFHKAKISVLEDETNWDGRHLTIQAMHPDKPQGMVMRLHREEHHPEGHWMLADIEPVDETLQIPGHAYSRNFANRLGPSVVRAAFRYLKDTHGVRSLRGFRVTGARFGTGGDDSKAAFDEREGQHVHFNLEKARITETFRDELPVGDKTVQRLRLQVEHPTDRSLAANVLLVQMPSKPAHHWDVAEVTPMQGGRTLDQTQSFANRFGMKVFRDLATHLRTQYGITTVSGKKRQMTHTIPLKKAQSLHFEEEHASPHMLRLVVRKNPGDEERVHLAMTRGVEAGQDPDTWHIEGIFKLPIPKTGVLGGVGFLGTAGVRAVAHHLRTTYGITRVSGYRTTGARKKATQVERDLTKGMGDVPSFREVRNDGSGSFRMLDVEVMHPNGKQGMLLKLTRTPKHAEGHWHVHDVVPVDRDRPVPDDVNVYHRNFANRLGPSVVRHTVRHLKEKYGITKVDGYRVSGARMRDDRDDGVDVSRDLGKAWSDASPSGASEWSVKPFTPIMQRGKSAVQHARITKPGAKGAVMSFKFDPKKQHVDIVNFRAYDFHPKAWAAADEAQKRGESADAAGNIAEYHRSNIGVIGVSGVRAAAKYLREVVGAKTVGGLRVSGSRMENENTMQKEQAKPQRGTPAGMVGMTGVKVKRALDKALLLKGTSIPLYRRTITQEKRIGDDNRVTIRENPMRGATYFATTPRGAEHASVTARATPQAGEMNILMQDAVKRGALRIFGHNMPKHLALDDVERLEAHAQRLAQSAPDPVVGKKVLELTQHVVGRPYKVTMLRNGKQGREYESSHAPLRWTHFEGSLPDDVLPGAKDPKFKHVKSATQAALAHMGYHGAAISDEAGSFGTDERPSKKSGTIALLPHVAKKFRPRVVNPYAQPHPVDEAINERAEERDVFKSYRFHEVENGTDVMGMRRLTVNMTHVPTGHMIETALERDAKMPEGTWDVRMIQRPSSQKQGKTWDDPKNIGALGVTGVRALVRHLKDNYGVSKLSGFRVSGVRRNKPIKDIHVSVSLEKAITEPPHYFHTELDRTYNDGALHRKRFRLVENASGNRVEASLHREHGDPEGQWKISFEPVPEDGSGFDRKFANKMGPATIRSFARFLKTEHGVKSVIGQRVTGARNPGHGPQGADNGPMVSRQLERV